MKLAALPALGTALACAALALFMTVDSARAQSSTKTPAPASKERQEAEAKMAEELARETMAADLAANARRQAAKEDAARAARVAAALAAPIVPVVTPDATSRGSAAAPATAALAGAAAALPGAAGSAVAGASIAPTLAAAPPAATTATEQRLALVIGNSSYRSSPLTNPVNDARAMAIKLQQLGFTVIKKENADREEMMNAVREFGNQLRNGGVGLFYYAGHGIQSKGSNYLVPVDADIRNEDELATRAYNANEVLEKMDTAKNRINMVVLDACRDNPFARSFRSGSRGLAGMDQTPTGTLVAYATSPGSTASDGLGANGLYTEQLLRAMSEPGLKLEDVFKRVRVNVVERSEGKQLPWEMSSVTGDFYFNPTSEQVNMAVTSAGGGGGARMVEQQRQLMPVLVSRKLIEHYQLTGSFPLQGQPAAATFSANGAVFAIAGKDRTLRSFDSMTGALTATETNYSDAALNGNRRALVGLGAQGKVSMHELAAALAKRNLDTLPAGVLQAGLSPNGKRLLVLSRDKGFQLFDADSLALVAQLDSVDGNPRFLFSPDGERLVTWGERESNMKLWDSASGKRINRLSDHWNPIGMVRFSADSATLFSAALDDKAVLWRASDGETIRKFEFGEGNPLPQQAEVINKGKQVLAYVQRSTKTAPIIAPMLLGVWDGATGRMVSLLLPEGVTLAGWRVAQEQNRLFINASDRTLYIVDLATLQRVGVLPGLEFIDLSPDGRRFLVKNAEGVRLMDLATMAPLGRMPGQVHAVAASKGNLFATCAADGAVTLWNFDNGEQVDQLKAHLDAVTGIVFADDGRHLVTLGSDNMAKLWAIPEIKDIGQLTKDQFESTTEYHKRMANWSSPYTSLVTLAGYNADAETFNVRLGDITAAVPLGREAAKKLMGQRQAIITAKLKFFDGEQLILADSTLSRLP